MKKSRILSGIVSLAVTLNYAISGYYASAVAYVQTDTDYIDYRYVGTEHAYDPLAELETEENEQRFRESADIAGNKIAFSVIESRTKGEETRYDLSGIYQKYRLYNLNKVYETANDSYSTEGAEAYEVFYEACTYSDDVWSIVDEMLEAENIISAEPVFIWNKASVGEPVEVSADEFARETHYSLLETKTVWNSLKNSDTPGKGAVVAVIDTGVDYTHKDLAENIWVNSGEIPDNGIDDDGNGYVDDVHGINAVAGTGDPMDDHGHGTHVAGVIAMSAGNGGGVGLAYGAQIMCIKAGSADGTFASSDIARAVKYAVDNGADVINMSFGGEERSSVVEAALNDAADYAVLIASAGNDGLPTSEAYENGYKNCKDVYPAGYNNVIGVMASDNEDKLARFSNWDYITGKGCEYEMTAPGVDIYSTLPDGRYAIWSGTSMASSCVAAAAALIRSEHPQKNKYDSKYITGQLINASTSKATAEPEIVTLPAITTESVTTTSTTTATTKPAAPLGNADVDGNAGISQEDFTYMLKAIVGAETLESGKGDVNNDGKVDMYDALSVLRLCSDPDSADAIISEPTANDEKIEFDIPTVDIVEDGDITNYTFTYNTDRIFKGVSGQLKFNDRNYSGEFKEINLISSSSSDIIYEFNPNNGKFVAYSANNDMSGNLTISAYDGEEGAYSVDLRSLKFYDENGKEFKDFDLGDFNPVMTFTPDRSVVAAAGTPTSVAVYDKHVEYPRLNIIDSLTRNPEPDFVVLGVTKSDRTDISEANNGDGIIQPDETVELGISLWNKWGAASDVTVKIEAIGFDGKPNPYVEVFDSSVALGDVAASSGTEASVRVKVKDNAPNDGKMEFRITVAAKNGFVSEDTAVYASESDYSFIVQRISYLRGKIKKDITLDPSRYWIIDGEVRLNEDVTMTILPGTQVQLGSELKEGSISTEGGNLICHGTIDSPIFLISGGKSSSVYFINDATVNTSYTIFYNIGTLQMNGSCEHCKLYVDNRISTGNYIMNLKDSIVYVPVDSLGIQAASNQAEIALGAATVENCLFSTTKLNYSQSVKNSVFVWADGLCDNDIFANNNIMQNNAILNKKEYGDWGVIDYSKTEIVASNFFGANYTNVTGAADNAENNYFETSKVSLTLASPEIENIYPFMTEAYVTNEKGERIENAYPGQTLMVHVKFNRDMATDVQPDVTVGIEIDKNNAWLSGFPSYMNYSVFGDWLSAREWIGQFSLDDMERTLFVSEWMDEAMEGKRDYFSDPPNLDSVLYIRSEGAVAADDRWLVTGNDGGRFGFNVVKPATVQTGDSETFRLTGKGIAGANQLNWEQGTLDTLAGYNLYRSTDNGASFTKLNRSLISGEDLQYIDRDVTEGQKYSYYFTTVDTDFHESARSNVVECVPLDGEKPTIVHTPVTYSEPEKAIVITADVTDNVKVDKVELFYKYGDEADWNSVSMRNPSGSTYRATLSAYEVREGKLQYYIAASDGISKSYVGNESEPCVITVSQYPETTTASESAVTTESTTASANATASTLGTTVNTTQSAASSESATETTATESIYTSTTGYSDTTTASTNVQYSGVRIEIVSRPTKTVYEMGESLDITGFKVKTWRIDSNGNEYADNNGDAYDVSDYISRFAISEFDSTVSGDQVITITYKRYNEAMELMTDSRSFTVFVRPAESETTTPITATTALATTETTTTNATTSVNSSSFEKTATSTEKATTTVTTSAMESSSESDTTTSYESETTASTTQTAATSTSTPVTTTDVTDTDYDLGDVNADGKVDAKDASMVLVEYAKMSTGGEGDFTEKQKLAANVNFDSKIDAKDASFILAYYAMASTASGDVPTMMEYMNKS